MTIPASIPEPSRPTEIALLELSQFAPGEPLDAVFRRACEVTAGALEIERVGVWLFIDGDTALRCTNLFERSKDEHSAGSILRVADFPAYFASLAIRKAVSSEIAGSDPWTAELAEPYLRPLGIASMLDAGILVDGKMVGVVCLEHVGPPREWTTEVRDFAGSVADRLALKIRSAEVRELRSAFLTQEERTVAQDKHAALERLAAGVAHDFRNLLSVCLGHGDLISMREDVPDDVREQVRDIVSAAKRGTALAQELMDFARPNVPPPCVLDLVNVTTELLPVLKAAVGARHELNFSHLASIGQVLIGKSQFTRLLMNLVINARDAMPNGGPIIIRLTPVKLADPGYLGRFILLDVADSGVGIDEVTRRRVFEPFFTTKPEGTGLGLAIVRQIVDRAGGLIRVESEPGQGTTFRVFFPRVGASTGTTAMHAALPTLQASEAS
jgi:two-component system cell cycle sensor histidine kinase/response regulator CckA